MQIYRAEVLYLLGVEKQMVISLEAKFTGCLLNFVDCPVSWKKEG
jgi:hypothetical protein